MLVIDAKRVADLLPYKEAVSALRNIYSTPNMTAHRHLHYMPELDTGAGTCMAAMPAWGPEHDIGAKVFTVFPHNNKHGLPTVQAVVIIFDGQTGTPKAVVDGTELTLRRTASMSALASEFLARKDARRLLVCGTGALAPHAALAHSSVRPIEQIEIWGRRYEAAAGVVNFLRSQRPDLDIQASRDLEKSAKAADIVSCQTSAPEPIIFGDWIRPGTHTDFVGSHSPKTRECDDAAVAKADIYVDVLQTALLEAGDLLIPIQNGTITKEDIIGDLSDLCRGRVTGRQEADTITLYKSTGSALADLATAELVVQKHQTGNPVNG